MSSVKISVITATWNSLETVEDSIVSFASQDYENKEHVIIDGASTDGTIDFVRGRLSDRAVFLSESDNGIYDALNKGINISSGDVIGFLHSDDIFGFDGVLSRVAAIFEDKSVSAVYGDLKYVKKNDLTDTVRYWKSCSFKPELLARGWMPPHPTLFVRRRLYNDINGFDCRYRIAADYDSVLKLFSLPNFSSVYVPEVFSVMRVGGASNKSFGNIVMKSKEDLSALRESGVGGFGTLFLKNFAKIKQFVKC